MRRARTFGSGAFWTLALGVPATLFALALVAYLDEHLYSIFAWAGTVLGADWDAIASEASARWPEVVGMLVGQLLLMTILVLGGTKALIRKTEAG